MQSQVYSHKISTNFCKSINSTSYKDSNFKTHFTNLITSDEGDDKEVNLYELFLWFYKHLKWKFYEEVASVAKVLNNKVVKFNADTQEMAKC